MQAVARNVPPPKPELKPKPGVVSVVRALYKYEAQNAEELSFEEGDVMYAFNANSNNDWWKARLGNKNGLIPSSYVESIKDSTGEPIHEAARRGNISFLQECVVQGVSVFNVDSMGNTALYWTAHSGHVDCLELLLSRRNPPINVKNQFGDTPLHAAASKGHVDTVKILLNHNADLSILNNNGETAEHLALDPAVKNLIQLYKQNGTTVPQKSTTYSIDDYTNGDDDDSE